MVESSTLTELSICVLQNISFLTSDPIHSNILIDSMLVTNDYTNFYLLFSEVLLCLKQALKTDVHECWPLHLTSLDLPKWPNRRSRQSTSIMPFIPLTILMAVIANSPLILIKSKLRVKDIIHWNISLFQRWPHFYTIIHQIITGCHCSWREVL